MNWLASGIVGRGFEPQPSQINYSKTSLNLSTTGPNLNGLLKEVVGLGS